MIMPNTKLTKQKGSKYWRLFVQKDGKYKVAYRHESKQLLKKKRAEIQTQSIDINALIAKRTFVDVYKEFAEYKLSLGDNKDLGGKPASMEAYMGNFRKHIAPSFDHAILVNEITVKIAIAFFTKLRGNGVSWITCNNVVKSFLTCLKYAKREEYITSVGSMEDFKAKDIPELVSKNPSEMKYRKTPMIKFNEADRLFKYFDPLNKKDPVIKDYRNFVIVALFLFTGMRLSELRGLKWKAIDLVNKTITVELTLMGAVEGYGKRDGSRRTYPIHPVLFLILTEWKAKHTRHFTPSKISWVIPTLLKTEEYVVPVAERTITDMLNLAYDALGFATVKLVQCKDRPDQKRVQVIKSQFGHAPTKTFRHFASTSLLDAQSSNEALNDNFITNYIGHKDIKTTRGIYGDHKDLHIGAEHQAKVDKALLNAIPLGIAKFSENN